MRTNYEQEENYQELLRSLQWEEGFSLLFVRCGIIQAKRLTLLLRSELSEKKIDSLRLNVSVGNLYEEIASLYKREKMEVLFIRGLENSLKPYLK